MIDEVLRVLEGVKKAGDGYTAKCPAHDDASASLSVKDKGGDAWPLLHCFTGCSFESIREAIEAKGVKRETKAPERETPRTIRERVAYPILSPVGNVLCTHWRLEWSDGSKSFSWEMPSGTRKLVGLKAADMLFGVEQLADLEAKRVVIVTEGEKAAKALRDWGAKGAVGTVCGASATPSAEGLEPLRGRTVFLWPDNDDLGRRHMERTAKALAGIAEKVRVIAWPGAPQKGDAADWLVNERKRADLHVLLEGAAAAVVRAWPEGVTPIHEPELMKTTLRDMEDFGRDERERVVRTGFAKLDRAIRGGFEPGECYLIGAPTGGGKTTVMHCFGAEAAKSGPVLFVTPEMTLVSMVRRELLRRSGIRERQLSKWAPDADREAGWRDLTTSAAQVLEQKPPLLLLDKPDCTMDDVEEAAESIEGLRLVLIDYAQEVADIDGRTPRYLQVGEVAHRSVAIAKRLNLPFVLASQVNVVPPKRKGGKRSYSFRESSVLEQKAGVVWIFDKCDPEDEEDSSGDAIEAEFRCRKNRHGPGFRVPVSWWQGLFAIGEPSDAEAPKGPPPDDMARELPPGDDA